MMKKNRLFFSKSSVSTNKLIFDRAKGCAYFERAQYLESYTEFAELIKNALRKCTSIMKKG